MDRDVGPRPSDGCRSRNPVTGVRTPLRPTVPDSAFVALTGDDPRDVASKIDDSCARRDLNDAETEEEILAESFARRDS